MRFSSNLASKFLLQEEIKFFFLLLLFFTVTFNTWGSIGTVIPWGSKCADKFLLQAVCHRLNLKVLPT